ncbi:hypothetical protein PR048_030344 [Dryococelus australis]|uniref:Uncharacterized protein n=1 Tax=Dryococelus australis TaxID=614101 RepID=A0ABQ9G974_9NEOP|nr:hypothetical protein PR048_030344 [Dryococelus australis]
MQLVERLLVVRGFQGLRPGRARTGNPHVNPPVQLRSKTRKPGIETTCCSNHWMRPFAKTLSTSQRLRTWMPKRRTDIGHCKAGPGVFPHPTSSQGRSLYGGRGGRAVSTLSSHLGEPGSIPGRITGLKHVGIVPFVGGFSRQSPASPALSFRRCSTLSSNTLISSQDLYQNSLKWNGARKFLP